MIFRIFCLFTLLLAGFAGSARAQEPVTLEAPKLVLQGVGFTATAKGDGTGSAEGWRLEAGGTRYAGEMKDGVLTFSDITTRQESVTLTLYRPDGTQAAGLTRSTLPGWVSLLPALIAIVAVLGLRQVIPSLTLGVWVGAALAYGLAATSVWNGFLDILPVYVTKALTDGDHVAIIIFTVMIGGLVGILTHNGGMAGIAQSVSRLARNPRRAQSATGILGLAVFFDDYANALIVGNTMRPITDRMRVSREKLAYIVDSTAAPVSTIAIVTTWIGFMVSVIDDSLTKTGIEGMSPYGVFLNSLAYSFYPFLAIILVWIVALSGRDFGPMLTAERKARAAPPRDTNEMDDKDINDAGFTIGGKAKPNLWLAVLPLLVLIFGTLAGVILTGMASEDTGPDAGLRDIFGAGNSFHAMMWASMGAVIVAMALSLITGRLNFASSSEAWIAGARSMMMPCVVLTLAWSIASVNEAVQTADYLITLLGGSIAPPVLPAIVFILSAAIAFTTGTSWGVMAIMMPLVLPLAWVALGAGDFTGTETAIFSATIAAVLSGAVWGDHCSPISDTTVMSSVASGCDHAEHVRTQLPYAMLGGITAVVAGLIPVGFGVPWWIALPLGAAVMGVLFRLLSRPVEG